MKAWLVVIALAALLPVASLSASTTPKPPVSYKSAEDKADEDYWEKYGEQREKWLMSLAFNPSHYFYFDEEADDPNSALETRNAVDARYWRGLRGIQWAFAIHRGCVGKDNHWVKDCANPSALIRVVSGKRKSENTVAANKLRPTTEEEMRTALGQWMRWEEAALVSCKGALPHMEKLNNFGNDRVWSEREEAQLLNKKSKHLDDDIRVRADGDYVIVRANSFDNAESHVWTDKNDAGTRGAWAVKMIEIVKPCLKPSASTPPWQKRPDPE